MVRLISKLGATGGLLTTAFVVDFSKVSVTQTRHKKADLEDSNTKPSFDDITKVEDIALIEKAYGCSFGFVASWSGKKVYTAEEFVKQENTNTKKHWKARVIQGVKHEDSQQRCQRKEKIILFNGNNNNGFVTAKPTEGW